MSVITSPHNPKIKYVLGLREKRERKKTGLLLVEGYAELSLALNTGARAVEVFFCPALFAHRDQEKLLRGLGSSHLIEVDERIFRKIAYRENPDGWLATLPNPQKSLAELRLSANPFILIVESVEKPGNLGAILRTADAAGVEAVIACDPLTDWGNPNIIRASKGCLFTVQVAEAPSSETLAWLRERGIQIITAQPDAATPYTSADFTCPTALVMGAEHAGVGRQWLAAAQAAVSIPMFGRVNSLNVSAAAALLMYEGVRQRRR